MVVVGVVKEVEGGEGPIAIPTCKRIGGGTRGGQVDNVGAGWIGSGHEGDVYIDVVDARIEEEDCCCTDGDVGRGIVSHKGRCGSSVIEAEGGEGEEEFVAVPVQEGQVAPAQPGLFYLRVTNVEVFEADIPATMELELNLKLMMVWVLQVI